ncbi:UvrD-helicase domain-containing protein [Chitinophaga tropicalis]|uniref:AAA family ATPase n=1 Tax=Chitinophaga tropicalis TaxID=2683588 RepID=A0A7K1UDB5_9BACT|nr:UvrD-helicase domain-containing protein [Chitinophaga tropicalis]MVT12364.1 AAA family ATPase [Chitinophaga tropicalis]
MLQITNDDIAHAEQILFNRTGVFDQERIQFIRELNTCDLQAVPGSGKTTVLLAKLLILERHLPLTDNRAILVISHTNAAIDEIRGKIGVHCPKLFSAPHFVGTIQAFVDKFLATPYYTTKLKQKPKRIDDDIYIEKASRFSTTTLGGFNGQAVRNARAYLNFYGNIDSIRFSFQNNQTSLTNGLNGRALTIKRPRSNANNDWNAVEKAEVLRWIYNFKVKILKNGYLCFDDAYYLADGYLAACPTIVDIIQKRFSHVFVDEMQDMGAHQYELLEKLFAASQGNSICYQRIGDKNQAIYTGISSNGNTWTDRPLVLQLNGSHRLTPHTARIVEKIACTPIRVAGLQTNEDGSPISLLPHILVYNDGNIGTVISYFADMVALYRASGDVPVTGRQSYKAICWNTKSETGKIRLNNYHPAFDRQHHTPKVNYDSLESYLLCPQDTSAFGPVVKHIGNALLRVLRMEDVEVLPGLSYNKTEFYKFLKEHHPQFYQNLQSRLYYWSRQVLLGQSTNTLTEITAFLPSLLALFQKQVNLSGAFITPNQVVVNNSAPNPQPLAHPNQFVHPDFNIDICTVHASKGQTHTATLYMESNYQKDIAGLGSHESERLAGYLLNLARPQHINVYVEQSLRTAYVGFSRPTHLLCFAVHEAHFNARLTGLDQFNPKEWTILPVP